MEKAHRQKFSGWTAQIIQHEVDYPEWGDYINMDAKRGFIPADIHNFSPEEILKLRTASRHILYLINEGYDLKQVSLSSGIISCSRNGRRLKRYAKPCDK